MTLPALLTVQDVAIHFRRSQKTIRRWLEEGMFPHAYHIRRGWYIPKRDVTALCRQDRPFDDVPAKRGDRRS